MFRIQKFMLFLVLVSFVSCFTAPAFAVQKKNPNIVLLFCDDLGYGDLGCYGHPTIATPNLDKMAAQGMKFTQFYSASPVCSPSRAALLTGRLPIRSGMNRVLFPRSRGGLPEEELTLAESLKMVGYRTACIGKWHLGHLPQFLPTRHGFDYYYGVPYSNDMTIDPKNAKFAKKVVFRKGQTAEKARNEKPRRDFVPLMRGEEIIEYPADQRTLTERYTEEAVKFIRSSHEKKQPFLVYLPYTMPHIPLFASEKFRGKSKRGLYGDVVETIDWSVGRINETLAELGIEENTIVIFTSDNGPWLIMGLNGGSAGLLREGKGTTWEGGMRVPCIMRWPGTIPAGSVTTEIASTMDIYTTCIKLAGGKIPQDKIVDGVDLRPVIFGQGPSPREIMPCYREGELWAYRKGPWKIHFKTGPRYGRGARQKIKVHNPPLLFHLNRDPSERFNVAKQNPKVIEELTAEVEKHKKSIKPGPQQS